MTARAEPDLIDTRLVELEALCHRMRQALHLHSEWECTNCQQLFASYESYKAKYPMAKRWKGVA